MKNNPKRFGFQVRWMLRLAEWRAGGKREVPWTKLPEVEMFPLARQILVEFYGLTVGVGSAGKDLGRVRLTFRPEELKGFEVEVGRLIEKVGEKLYPIGDVDEGDAVVLVAESGSTYMWVDDLILVSRTFDDALQRMLLGLRYEGSQTEG